MTPHLTRPRGRPHTIRLDDVGGEIDEILVELREGQAVIVQAGDGVAVELERFASGAVELRNVNTRRILRQWTPKEASEK